MKTFKLYIIALLVLMLALLMVAAANAQGSFTASPAQLTVSGAQGAVETRTLLLRTTDPITDLRAISLDVTRDGSDAVLPAKAVKPSLPASEIAAGDPLTVPVVFDLHNAPCGKFSGELLFNYHGGALTVPVSVTVKAPWPLPLFVLVAGVALGTGVSAYRAQGRPRDRVLVRIGRLQNQVQSDTELAEKAESFLAQIKAYLVDAEAALRAEKWETAQGSVEQATAVWTRWRKGRSDWLAQLAYHAELEQRLTNLSADAPYVQAVRHGMEDAIRNAPELEGPAALRKQQEEIMQQINRYVEMKIRLNELNQAVMELPSHEAKPWQRKSQDLQRKLARLNPEDEAAYQSLQGEVEQVFTDVEAEIEKQEQRESAPGRRGVLPAAKSLSSQGTSLLKLLGPAPSAQPLTLEEQATGARVRLRWFTRASYVVAVAMLAGAGFGELYITNAAFGANAWADYFALLAWGFGAEATRAAVAQMVGAWGLPGIE